MKGFREKVLARRVQGEGTPQEARAQGREPENPQDTEIDVRERQQQVVLKRYLPQPREDNSALATPDSTLQRMNTLNELPRLQVVNASSSSKPDNYRISPVTPTSAGEISPFENWSGRGSHVDFLPNESVPLTEGRFLGHGVMGGVYETIIRGEAFAWKRRYCRRQIGEAEMKEIEILKKLSHPHVVQLVGTYTHKQFLGLLLYPVATCDLADFLDDMETIFRNGAPVDLQQARFVSLGTSWDISAPDFCTNAREIISACVISKIGCLISAVEYLHANQVRHKDLKPSNILLSRDQIWLTDFGSATDFSLLSTSATESGERGTPKYFAPEVACYKANGRAADIFSLGCILLEILVVDRCGTLDELKALRTAEDRSFQANLKHKHDWLALLGSNTSPRRRHLQLEIVQMLDYDPEIRPLASELRMRLTVLDQSQRERYTRPYFRNCCQDTYITRLEHEAKVKEVAGQQSEHWMRVRNEYADKLRASETECHRMQETRQWDIDILHTKYRANLWEMESKNKSLKEELSRRAYPENADDPAQEARIRTLEKQLFAEKTLTATLEEALTDMEASSQSMKDDLEFWKKKYSTLDPRRVIELAASNADGPR
ncbi:kinase-like domain-containing protein [Lophiotrema nucula]|uniref:Kinase-like domain-containing protein n=1 Tax=Lophiotrema nucula TaxID=690887 RepID=A0A6A5YRU1_9PLEO|nr:kinase-like domain-containing protein [Lophiotrema nucula]